MLLFMLRVTLRANSANPRRPSGPLTHEIFVCLKKPLHVALHTEGNSGLDFFDSGARSTLDSLGYKTDWADWTDWIDWTDSSGLSDWADWNDRPDITD